VEELVREIGIILQEQNERETILALIGFALFVFFILIFLKIRDYKLLRTVTKLNRGTRSERKLVLTLLKYRIPAQTIFHDLYVKKSNNKYSQIDLAVATKVGIIVFEVKDFSGWIYGTGYKPQWTKVLAYGKKKYQFYNPILQNDKHIQDLRKQLYQFKNIPFYSVIVFYGDCELKDINFVPKGTFIAKSDKVLKAVKTIMKNNEPAPYTNKHEVVRVLKEAVNNGESAKTHAKHVEDINDMMGKERIFD
jgi:hypothetical protein